MQIVSAGLRDSVDNEAAGPPVFGRDAAAGDVNFLDVELREVLIQVAEEWVRDIDAIIEECVVLPEPAGARRCRIVLGHASRELERSRERAGEW